MIKLISNIFKLIMRKILLTRQNNIAHKLTYEEILSIISTDQLVLNQVNNKTKIINTSTELFHLNGFVDTSVDQILDRCGVSKSNFYYHFESKIQLALLILTNEINRFEKQILDKLSYKNQYNPDVRIKNMYFQVANNNKNFLGSFCGNFAIEMSNKNEIFRKKISDFYLKWKFMIEDCIEDGIKRGVFEQNIDKSTVSTLIITHIEGCILLSKTTKMNHLEE